MPGYYAEEMTSYRNVIDVFNIALNKYYGDLLFHSEYDRIVYSSTDYALRRRSEGTKNFNLNLPFMNFKVTDIDDHVDRNWFKHVPNFDGIFVPELNRKLRIHPTTISYDATAFFHRDMDEAMYATTVLHWDDSNETIIKASIEINNEIVNLIGVLGYDIDYDPTYNENDWLKQHRIHSVQMNFSIQTFMIRDNLDISIPDEVILEFATMFSDNNYLSNEQTLLAIQETYAP